MKNPSPNIFIRRVLKCDNANLYFDKGQVFFILKEEELDAEYMTVLQRKARINGLNCRPIIKCVTRRGFKAGTGLLEKGKMYSFKHF